METKVTSPALKGTLIALVLIVYSLLTYFIGQAGNKSLGYLSFLLLAVAVIGSCIVYANQNNGNVTYGNTFADGFKTTAAATAITLVYSFLALKFIMPDIIDISLDATRKGMVEKKVPQEQMDATISFMQKYFVILAIASSLFMYLVVGLIASLIGAAIAKKNPEASPFNQ